MPSCCEMKYSTSFAHVAGATNPRTASPGVIENIKRLRAGRELIHRVDPKSGY